MSCPERSRTPATMSTNSTATTATTVMTSRHPETAAGAVLDLAGDDARTGRERLLQQAHRHLPAGGDRRRELLGALDVLPGRDEPGHAFLALLNADHVSDRESHQCHHDCCPPGVVVTVNSPAGRPP